MAAQGFDRARPKRPDVRHFRRVFDTLGLLQLDFVNVLLPAHYLVLWSRLGRYERKRFDRFVYGCGSYTEQWAHEASLVHAELWPLLAHRRAAYKPWPNSPMLKLDNFDSYLDEVLEFVVSNGAITASDLPGVEGPRRKPGDWHRSVPRWALEHHFGRGSLAVANRLPNFQRVYDLAERVIPSEFFDCVITDDDAQSQLLLRAARAFGVATLQDLADYYRMSPRDAAPLVARLVEDGKLHAVCVEGWQRDAYLATEARFPRSIGGASLLSPFDPLVWFRPRTERLFGFHYRIEIYVPEAKRKWGYYVLPFRLGDEIVARTDLKADRANRRLLVQAAYIEEGKDESLVASAMADELAGLAEWLELDDVVVRRNDGFSRQLHSSL